MILFELLEFTYLTYKKHQTSVRTAFPAWPITFYVVRPLKKLLSCIHSVRTYDSLIDTPLFPLDKVICRASPVLRKCTVHLLVLRYYFWRW